ncbi:MAG: DUF2267 domain-containing protein [Clostridia bacterium]|nr:DUF2267 domain-containing protein [Clostridia bacterium]
MNFDRFIGEVQHAARLASAGEAIAATRATLTTLAERLSAAEARELAAQLPRELQRYVEDAIEAKGDEEGERFSLPEFFDRVAVREDADAPRAAFHARAVLSVLRRAVTPGAFEDVLAQLPDDWDALLTADAEGELRLES